MLSTNLTSISQKRYLRDSNFRKMHIQFSSRISSIPYSNRIPTEIG
uniref:Uncharacterized protein n=1 Tax=Siphoviridae sp. ctgN495 TaxID=2825608 RepID=A0A8S5UCF0_9CAUD|nr:MAG TPA: hypothetical protein [Siphoviridae sp. ctgN495]